jgi:TolB-like protein/class 3 adenylate cyclase
MTEMRVQRRLAAIAIVDVVGYSRMMGSDESGTLAAVTERRKRIIEPVVAAHDGRIVKMMGDGFFIEFASAVNAVEAALEMQARMAEANDKLSTDRRIVLRIGINLGEVIVEGDDLFGDGVNVAARLESIASEGGIAISGSAYEQVKGRINAVMEDSGAQALKNIAEPVRVYRVTAAPDSAVAGSLPVATTSKSAVEKPAIAILPFANLGEDPAQGFFSDGITEDIITELSRWRSLAVRSRSASFRYRGVAVDMKQVARELNVRYIVEGSVRRMGDRVRITAQLIDSETGSHIWAEKFDREAMDIFSVQDQVVRTIVSTLVGRVQVSDIERARRKPPSSLAAYEYMLQGNAIAWDTPEGLAEATRLFEKAVEIDPGYGFAHALLAATCYSKWYADFSGSDALLQQGYVQAKRAVELDENESTCFSMLALVCLLRHSFDLALQHSRRAIEINPNNQWNNADMGLVLTYLGRPEEALDWFKRAREIDPYFDPPWYWRGMGQTYMVLHRYEEAVSMLEHPSTGSYRLSALKAGCLAQLGDTQGAEATAKECLTMKPEFSIRMFMSKEPFKNPADAAHQTESLRMAGLPD